MSMGAEAVGPRPCLLSTPRTLTHPMSRKVAMRKDENPILTSATTNPSSATIDSIPNEVLGEISLNSLPPYLWQTTMAATDPPVLLTHVCRR